LDQRNAFKVLPHLLAITSVTKQAVRPVTGPLQYAHGPCKHGGYCTVHMSVKEVHHPNIKFEVHRPSRSEDVAAFW